MGSAYDDALWYGQREIEKLQAEIERLRAAMQQAINEIDCHYNLLAQETLQNALTDAKGLA